ncbi:MAG: nuclear transport factor 2 family protein, partial [Peristeroidobacter soli]
MSAKTLLALLLVALSPAALAQRAGPAQTQQQFDEVAAADQALFSAFFDRCDTEALAKMVTDDFEMFHDKNGYMTKSGEEFLKGIKETCARQKTGEDYRARRELVPGTLKVYPLENYGAIEIGVHKFYQLLPGKPE